MPVQLDTFANTELRMRWMEPYVTEGLNRKDAVVIPRGVYRGFTLEVDGGAGNNTVQVTQDATWSDHVAVLELSTGFSLKITRTTGSFLVTLSDATLLSTTCVIVLQASYTVGATTTGEVQAYTLADWNLLTTAQQEALVVLGTVVNVAGGNPIPAANITADRRSLPWKNEAGGAVAWTPLIHNGSFDQADDSATYQFAILNWSTTSTANVTASAKSAVAVNSGSRALVFEQLVAGAGTATATQNVGVTVVPGQLVYYQFYLRTLLATTAGTFTFGVGFRNSDGVYFDSVETVTLDTTSVDGAYRLVSGIIEVPAAVYALDGVQIAANALVSGASTGNAILIDDVQVFLQRTSVGPQADRGISDYAGPVTALGFTEVAEDYTTMPGGWAQLRYNSNTLFLERPDPSHTGSLPDLDVGGRILNLGDSRIGTDANAILPRLLVPPSSERLTLIEQNVLDTGISVRKYVANRDGGAPFIEGVLWTYNAAWNNATLQWDRDNGTDHSFMYEFAGAGAGLLLYSTLSSEYGGAWSHPGGWARTSHTFAANTGNTTVDDGYFSVINATTGTSGSNISLGSEQANTLYAKNMVKAWGKFAAGPSSAASISAGFNVQNPVITGSGYFQFDLVQAVASTSDFTVIAMGTDSAATSHPICFVQSVTSSSRVVIAVATSGGTLYDFNSAAPPNSQILHVMVIGAQ